ncbi:uncharacterized protein BO96DRAFT_16781 [Aspergillus niger CBS 101883]|uniref:uncharacterized protein n=1 Tax=Aspergillus lacticoffeatus (strain CBS 101883) TaxID=1450533 RepID=UPI000D7FB261|nr:uncharacterized protein BO96DRAFT_16781 [Aspergillus niger CBS 101883]PYH62602.1 hypothetical protein BO96DRAFT_16781 [Aspergillus niger CBS 101883]
MIFALFLGCVAALAHFFPSSSSAHHLADIQGNGVWNRYTHSLFSSDHPDSHRNPIDLLSVPHTTQQGRNYSC